MDILLNFDFLVLYAWTIAVFFLWRGCKKAGHITTESWLFIGATSVFWFEAPWNWILHVRYNPEKYLAMFPSDWPILNMAGGLPLHAPLIYGIWFIVAAVFAKTFLARPGWTNTTIIIVALMFGAAFECVAEIVVLAGPGKYYYTHVIPNMALFEGLPHQYPMDVPIWLALSIGGCIVTLLRSRDLEAGKITLPTGNSLVAQMGRLRSFGGNEDGIVKNLIWVVGIYNVTYMITAVPALLTRLAGWRSSVGDATPFGICRGRDDRLLASLTVHDNNCYKHRNSSILQENSNSRLPERIS